MSEVPLVQIRYRRLPDREELFRQRLVHADDQVRVTFLEAATLRRDLRVGERVILENGAPAIWFTFPDAWHDIGRFHLRDGSFTGLYANVITPVRFLSPLLWETTDLFLDVWVGAERDAELLDQDELDDAHRNGWISGDLAARASTEAERLLRGWGDASWPPAVVHEWTLDRVRARSIR